ncbi:MAG: N-acetylmuramoyl-L-alanine amidase [Candidatus Pelagisphaera sp.]|jgi:N-acetylmuramoyl-L-alanine amidase
MGALEFHPEQRRGFGGSKPIQIDALVTLANQAINQKGELNTLLNNATASEAMNDIEEQYRRAAFNIVARNQDDHTKNIAFLMNKTGQWRLKQRADAVNKLHKKTPSATYARCLVVHIDGRSRNQDIDVFFYHHKTSTKGKRLATDLRDTMKAKYKAAQPNRSYEGTVSTRNLYMIDHTTPPVVFMELGNIHNVRDQKRILQSGNRQALANWLCQGILNDRKKG